MGVKNLLAFLRELNSTIVQTIDLSAFAGNRIAIDVATRAYAFKSRYITKVISKMNVFTEDIDYNRCNQFMFKQFMILLDQMLNGKICPVMVFDGSAPVLKDGTKRDRASKSKFKKDRIAALRRIAQILMYPNPGETLSDEDLSLLNELKIRDMEGIRDRLTTDIKAFIVVTAEDYLKLQCLCSAMGIPFVIAKSEAEKTCAMMCRKRDVLAVFSADSDALMYGCPILINELTFGVSARIEASPTAQCYTYENMLMVLNMTEQQALDFCIMNGTDFNANSPGMGSAKNYELLHTYGSLRKMQIAKEQLVSDLTINPWLKLTPVQRMLLKYDFSVLNLDEVRQYLTTPEPYDREGLKIKLEDKQLERSVDHLSAMLGPENFKELSDTCVKIVGKLKVVAQLMRV